MRKAKIKIIIYEENGRTKVKVKNKKSKKLPKNIYNLYVVLSSKIKDYLKEI